MHANTLKCVDARHFIHLAVGDDTLPEEEQQLAEHLHGCSDCRSYNAGMVDAMHAMQSIRDEDVADTSSSLWPAMASRLQVHKSAAAHPERRRFNGAVVALCACSMMLALVTAVQNLPANSVDPYADFSGMPAQAMSVGFRQDGNGQAGQLFQGQLVQMVAPDGSVVLVDRVTGRHFRPQHQQNAPLPKDQSLEF